MLHRRNEAKQHRFSAIYFVMDEVKWQTPNKIKSRDGSSMNSPRLHMTPVKQNEIGSKRTAYHNNAGCFTVLPSYITPPSGLTKINRRNPFEADLTSRLHRPMISPTIFTKISDPMTQESPEFRWSIDELARIRPAKIEESPMQQVSPPDPELEMRAQAAIDRFFKENQIIPSPWLLKEKTCKPYNDVGTPPCRPMDDISFNKEILKSKKEAWTQTILSLPVNLPQNIEDTLKTFYTFTQEQNTDEDVNSSNTSLRRKLFFNHDNDNDSIASFSSVEMSGSMVLSSSPPQSGMFIHGSLKGSVKCRRHSFRSVSLSPPYMSPIRNEDGVLCEKIRRRSRSITQLDLVMDMSIDLVGTENYQNSCNGDLSGISHEHDEQRRHTNLKDKEDSHKMTVVTSNKNSLCDFAGIDTSRYTDPIGDTIQHNPIVSNDNTTSSATATEIEKSSMHKSHKQSNTMFGIFDPSSISNSVQDTGYQTYSMNSTMHMIDSYSISTQNHNVQPKEQTVMFKDDAQLSWKEDMRNVFSSTPSKYKTEES